MKKFKILAIFGSFLVGIPALMVVLIVFSFIRDCDRHELQGLYKSDKTNNIPDTIIVEKIVEKTKVDTFYIKSQPQPIKPIPTPEDTL